MWGSSSFSGKETLHLCNEFQDMLNYSSELYLDAIKFSSVNPWQRMKPFKQINPHVANVMNKFHGWH